MEGVPIYKMFGATRIRGTNFILKKSKHRARATSSRPGSARAGLTTIFLGIGIGQLWSSCLVQDNSPTSKTNGGSRK